MSRKFFSETVTEADVACFRLLGFKRGSHVTVSNYRHISLLSNIKNFSKNSYSTEFTASLEHLYGFRKKHSIPCSMLLLTSHDPCSY